VEPAIVTAYAGSGFGKSLDAIYSFPQAVFLTPARGGLVAAQVMIGRTVREEVVPTLTAAKTRIVQILKEPAYKNPRNRVVVLDDFSILCERTMLQLEDAGVKGWDVWKQLGRQIQGTRDYALDATVTTAMNAHIAPPKKLDSGALIPGGPLMPSQKLSGILPGVSTLVLRGEKDAFVQPPLWPGVWCVDTNDGNWLTKDRYCVVGPKVPMNTREILFRAAEAGHKVIVPARLPGLEWLDAAAEKVAEGLTSAFPTPQAAAEGLARAPGLPSKDPRLLRWAWRDGVARHRLRTEGAAKALFAAFIAS